MKLTLDVYHHFVRTPETEQFEKRVLGFLETILQQGVSLMSKISEYAAKMEAHLDKIDAAIDGVAGDVATLNALIQQLQTSPGTISPEDQATLDLLEARGATLADKVSALDDLTPPAAPAEGPPPPVITGFKGK